MKKYELSIELGLGRKQNQATRVVTPYIPSRRFVFFTGSAFIDRNIHRFKDHLISGVGQNIVFTIDNAER